MRRDHRRSRRLERIIKRLVGHVRDVDHHTQPVHFPYDVAPERRKAVVHRLIGAGVGPVVGLEMRQGHVADAQPVIIPKHRQAVGDKLPTLQAQQRGDLSGPVDADDVVRRGRHFEVFRVAAHLLVQGIDPLERSCHPQRLREILRLDVDAEEDCSHSPAPQSWDIRFVVRVLFGELVTFIDECSRRYRYGYR